MPFEGFYSNTLPEQRRIAQDRQSPEQQGMIEAQRRQQDALIVLEEAKKQLAEAQQSLNPYQVQAFEAWQSTGFRDPSSFYVYEDGTTGYHVTDYFTEDPPLLFRVQQLARAVENAQSTYQMTTDIVDAKTRTGVQPVNMEQVYRYTMPELPTAKTEAKPQTLGQALDDWNRGYGQLQTQTQEHFTRIQNLFTQPFQMPTPGSRATAELPSLQSARLDEVFAEGAPLPEQQIAQSSWPEPISQPGAAFARPDELTQEIQIPAPAAVVPLEEKTPWYRRALRSLFR